MSSNFTTVQVLRPTRPRTKAATPAPPDVSAAAEDRAACYDVCVPEPESCSGMSTAGLRWGKIMEVSEALERGSYTTDEKLDAALERMIDTLTS